MICTLVQKLSAWRYLDDFFDACDIVGAARPERLLGSCVGAQGFRPAHPN